MTAITLQPVLKVLGYAAPSEQLSFVKLLHAAGCFGDVETGCLLSDRQAQAILSAVTFDSSRQAAEWLHQATQEHMLRPKGTERWNAPDHARLESMREQILPLLTKLHMTGARLPRQKHYDHALVLGASQPAVENRLAVLKQMWEDGVRFDRIYLLGSARSLDAKLEPLAATHKTETGMMEELTSAVRETWPAAMQNIPITVIDTQMRKDGKRPYTRDTVAAWLDTKPKLGRVLAVSNQPYAQFQQEAVESVLPDSFKVETIGAASDTNCVRLVNAVDAIARRIEVGLPRLLEKLEKEPLGFAKVDSVQIAGVTSPEAAKKLHDCLQDMPGPKVHQINLPVNEIRFDPATYQFRHNANKNGISNNHRQQAENWDPILNGDPILVHQRINGEYFVADGHHRTEFAQRLNAQGKGPTQLSAIVLREADGYTAKDARIAAAFKNIAHEGCDLIDAAKILKTSRDTDVHRQLLPTLPAHKQFVRDAEKLSTMSDEAFSLAERGEVPGRVALKVAEQVDAPRQTAVMSALRDKLKAGYAEKIRAEENSHSHGQAL